MHFKSFFVGNSGKRFRAFLLILPLLLVGCGTTRQLQLTEFSTGETMEAFLDPATNQIRAYMPDGKVITGKYTTLSNARFTFGGGIGNSGGRIGIGVLPSVGLESKANIYAMLTSSDSSLAMEVIADFNKWTGRGKGEARTNDGREYSVIF